jgi:uncharacterized protein (TIGR00661 family)
MSPRPKILFAVLDWGIGHATRSKPVIEYLISKNCEVVLAVSGHSAKYLKTVFPESEFLYLPDYKIHYSKSNNQVPILFRQMIKNYAIYLKEKKIVNSYIADSNIDIIISDNRFGVYSKQCKSYYITHQLQFRISGVFKVFQKLLAYSHSLIMKNFDAVLIPDDLDNSIAGIISENKSINIDKYYLGPLSRFCFSCSGLSANKQKYVLFLLSGPEPQRSILEKLLLSAAKNINKKLVMVRGLPESNGLVNSDGIEIIDFAGESQLQNLIINAEFIVCRSGYSTIMDLWTLKRKAILIPTPGQPEQEYLAKYLHSKYGFEYLHQNEVMLYNWNTLNLNFKWDHNGKTDNFKNVIDKIIFNTTE